MFTGCNCYLFVIFMVIKRLFVCDSVLAVLLNRSVSFSRGKEGLLLFTSFIFLMQLQSGQQARGVAGPSLPSQPQSQAIDVSRASLHVFHTLCNDVNVIFLPFSCKRANTKVYPVCKIQLCLFYHFSYFSILSFVSSLLIPGFCLNIFTRCKT